MFIAIVNPDSFEYQIARSERVDEAIDRTIKRLMQVKRRSRSSPRCARESRAETDQR